MGPKATLLPFYIVCDVSASMRAEGRMEALNEAIASTCDALAMHPVIADRVRMSIISFAGQASIDLPLCDVGLLERVPRLTARDVTAYTGAFRLLRSTIESDVAQLVFDDFRVFRPAAFFLTDGRPTDRGRDWRLALSELRADNFPHRPHLVSFGLGDADPSILAEVGDVASYTAADAASAPAAITAFGSMLVESVVASGATGTFQLPAGAADGLEPIDEHDFV